MEQSSKKAILALSLEKVRSCFCCSSMLISFVPSLTNCIGTEKGLLASIEKGIGTMKRLECAKFTIKPDYGYGAEGNTVLGIPGNATLIYEIRLNNFTKVSSLVNILFKTHHTLVLV